ncbi:hypothetical protein ACQP1G_08900 [Nocardia sp. CA-107356]|uniref:hypothetical protein n=1 Tax=Nocardia sp. CA-107356 TaxID=3239972 RepID=UPI003D947FF7
MTTATEAPVWRAERAESDGSVRQETRWTRLLFGSRDQPRWARPGLWALLAVTAVLYLWGLSRSGWSNDQFLWMTWEGVPPRKMIYEVNGI